MVKLKIEVDDWDTGETTELMLPCEVKHQVDASHDLQIVDWEADFSIGFDDVVKLNQTIEDINSENPSMTLKLLTIILKASDSGSFSDKRFIEKVCNNDFMLEKLTNIKKLPTSSDEERCACYLATEMFIPFAKNITTDILEQISKKSIKDVDWKVIWNYYYQMGFKVVNDGNSIYAFHWGNSEQ